MPSASWLGQSGHAELTSRLKSRLAPQVAVGWELSKESSADANVVGPSKKLISWHVQDDSVSMALTGTGMWGQTAQTEGQGSRFQIAGW